MARLTMAERKDIKREDFAIPEKAPGPGSYPIENREHAEKALQLSGGKAEEARVKAAVKKKYPDMGDDKKGKEGSAEEERTESKSEAKAEGDDDMKGKNHPVNKMLRRTARRM